jgi:hypothetical protein
MITMDITLKVLNKLKCSEYIKQSLMGMLFFSDKISHELDLNHGTFYTLAPKDVREEDLYNFEIGGRVYPFKREEGELIKQLKNKGDNIIMGSLVECIKSDPFHSLCFEDYSADPGFPYIIKSNRQYFLIDNKVFYLIDSSLQDEEIRRYFNWVRGYGFLGMLLKMNTGLDRLNINVGKELSDLAKGDIFKSINSFFVEVYDGESYLLWINNREGETFLDILTRKIESLNALS